MTRADATRAVPWLRYALLAAALSAVWLVIGLFTSAPSASADEGDSGSGLLGTVGSVVGGVTNATGTVGDTVAEVVETVVEPVAEPVVEPVIEAAPAPVAEVAPSVVDTATDAANGTISGTNTAVGTLVNGLASSVSDVAGGGTVGAVVDPLAGGLDDVVGGLPILGDVVGDDTVVGVVSPVTGLVDGTLGTVVGSVGELSTDGTGILPQLPGIPLLPDDSETTGGTEPGVVTTPVVAPGTANAGPPGGSTAGTAPHSRDFDSAGAESGLPGSVTPADGGAPPGGNLPATPGVPGGGSTSGTGGSAGGGGASGTSDAAFAALELDALASLVLHSVDDALPSSPVYDTDTTPD